MVDGRSRKNKDNPQNVEATHQETSLRFPREVELHSEIHITADLHLQASFQIVA